MHTVFFVLYILASIIWGDWKNWKEYYSTFLFFVIGDLLYQFLLYNHTMWFFHISFDEEYLKNHTMIALAKMVVQYSTTTVIFLGNYPKSIIKQFLWISLWVAVFASSEYLSLTFWGGISHHHGWTMGWSILFDYVMFTLIRIHFSHPLVAWGLSLIFIIVLWHAFDLNLDLLK
ncbi:CBO0543 family protein [Pseudalkalibacillus caeni]|uniref:Uncharacterized protein n=1 Tax=Exobacillus caeni TaxID=2574798 RepID=A0A5R9EYE0_9BACL|nr:CBO0543 family protein [Pseudalkalibacillus caeni]TLS35216.1 hypothetical protein FCL54_21705 [Pseudalkalibacillus caeni]